MVGSVTKLLEKLLQNGLDDVPKSIKILENFSQILQKSQPIQEFHNLDKKDITTFSTLACSTYFYVLSSAKLARALDKIFKLLPVTCLQKINQRIEIELNRLITQKDLSQLKILSLLLEQCAYAKSCVKNYFYEVTEFLLNVLYLLKAGDKTSQQFQGVEFSHYAHKLIIQVLQLFQHEIKELYNVNNKQEDTINISGQDQWQQILIGLLLTFMQTTNRDVLLLIGTAIAMLSNLVFAESCFRRNFFMDLLNVLSKEEIMMSVKDVSLDLTHLIQDQVDTSNHTLAVIKGVLVSCDQMLFEDKGGCLMLSTLPHILNLCLGSVDHHYLAFQILSLWYQKFMQLTFKDGTELNFNLKQLQQQIKVDDNLTILKNSSLNTINEHENDLKNNDPLILFSLNCPVLQSTLSCIWLNWDSPVSGVPEYIIDIFSTLLSLLKRTNVNPVDGDNVIQLLLHQLLHHETQPRVKYRALTLLLPYVDGIKLLHENPQLKDKLISCMSSNNMAAIATDLYRAFIEQLLLVHNKDCTQHWKDLWMCELITGLTSQDRLQCSKVCTYWLVPTLKIIPDSSIVLLSFLEHKFNLEADYQLKNSFLFGWVNVQRFSRDLLHQPFPQESVELLKQALCSSQDELRSEAFLILCSTLKKAEPLSEVECELLQEFIPSNLKTDSAPFRQSLVSGLKKVLVRIRDSCLTAISRKKTADFLDHSLIFVDWLYQIIMLNLTPGSSYQSRRTAVDMLTAVLETLVYDENDTSKKGKAQATSNTLINYVHARGLWDFFNEKSFITVLTCLEDGAQEIQTLCYNLLDKYFKWPTELIAIQTKIVSITSQAMLLLSSPRAYETHTGVLIMSLYLKKYVLAQGITLSITPPVEQEINVLSKEFLPTVTVPELSDLHPTLSFMDHLLQQINISLQAVSNDISSGFKSHPIHGLTSCVSQSLTDMCKVWSDFDSWRTRLQEIFWLNQSVINLMLDVMAGGKSLESCPSFADMGMALSTLIDSDQDDEELLSISPSLQLLFSWCWINIKESCSCLGELTRVVLLHPDREMLSVDVLYNIGQIFVKVLTSCRHRGAIEGCREGFLVYTLNLMSSIDQYFNNIPQAILDQILNNLLENSLTSSVTRRSAGLPIIVHIVLLAAHKAKHSELIMSCVGQLYDIAAKPLPDNPSQLQDLSQSHVLNILTVIFCDATLAPTLMPLLSKMTILVIKGFDSPSWAIRNAATQLISTLITRIVGQKSQIKTTISLAEFGVLYSELLDFMVSKLESCLSSPMSTSLYIVLTLLSHLNSAHSRQQDNGLSQSLQSTVSSLVANPVYSLRTLSAKAFVAIVPFDKSDEGLASVLLKLQQKEYGNNHLHGWLLCAHNFLLSGYITPDMKVIVVTFVLDNLWLLSYSPCLMVTRTVLDVLQLCLADISIDVLTILWSEIVVLMEKIENSVNYLMVDGLQCLQCCLQTLLIIVNKHVTSEDVFQKEFAHIVCKCLCSNNGDVRWATLDIIDTCLDKGTFMPDARIQEEFLNQMIKEHGPLQLAKTIEIIMKLKLSNYLQTEFFQSNIPVAVLQSKWSTNKCVTSALFSLQSLIVGTADDLCIQNCDLYSWSQQLVNYSQPTENEKMRLLAAQALCIAGETILDFSCRHTTLDQSHTSVVCIFKSCLQLLEDTETEVRETVSRFISHLEGKTCLHYTLCFSILSKLIVRFSWCESLHASLLDIIVFPGHLCEVLKATVNSRVQHLFEPEVTSAFSEPFILQFWAFQTLEKFSDQNSLALLLNNKIKAALTELTAGKVDIDKVPQIFNVSCNAKVLSALFGIFLLAHLYKHCMEYFVSFKFQEGEDLFLLITELQKNVNLHPFLKKNLMDLKLLLPFQLQ